MATDHTLPHYKAMSLLKVSQTISSAVILALCTYEVAIMPFTGCVFAFWTALLTLIILAYYFISLRDELQIYKALAIFALDVTGFLVWLATCSTLLGVYDLLISYDEIDWFDWDFDEWDHVNDFCEGDRSCHQMFDFMARDEAGTFGPVLAVALAFCCLQVILYCGSVSIISNGLYRHSKTGLFEKHSNGSIDSIEVAKTE